MKNPKSLIDRDQLNGADQATVAKTMVRLFDHIQQLPREIQLLALAAAFVIMAEALKFSTSDTYQAVINLMKDSHTASGRGTRFDAMKWHIETELAHDA